MVHRPDRVVSDIDDRLIGPNAARNSLNLRMAASVNDTNLGITLVNGMSELVYAIPAGDNKCIGAKEDFESQSVFFALWNFDSNTNTNNHGIYRIQGGNIDLVIGGSILNFDQDSDVSIAVIDGKIYWTDNINQPRMVNIAKGIANLYPSPLEEWMITQIKRPPAFPLTILPNTFTLEEASIEYQNLFPNPIPVQFTYYYVYDNDEESRMGPWSKVIWWSTNLTVTIPSAEYNTFLSGINVVTAIVFVFRRGNDGIPYSIRRVINDVSFTGSISIPDISLLPKSAVSSDITNADFDSVPLLSISNEIAQNRLNHGNYSIDYPNWSGLTLTVTPILSPFPQTSSSQSTFKPGGVYNVGIELLDLWGRKIGVVSQQQVQIPDYEKWNYNIGFQDFSSWIPKATWEQGFSANNPYWDRDDGLNSFYLSCTVTGTLPSWCSTYRIVYTPVLNVVNSQRTNVKMYYWYTKEGSDYLSYIDAGQNANGYYRNGMCLELTSSEPFLLDSNKSCFLNIIGCYGMSGAPVFGPIGPNPIPSGWNKKYKIKKQVNVFLYFEIINSGDLTDITPAGLTAQQPIPGQDGFPLPSYWDIELTEQSNSPSEVYYQNTSFVANTSPPPITIEVYGDYFRNKYIKPNFGQLQNVIKGLPFSFYYDKFQEPTVTVYGIAISRNPTNLFSQDWNKTIGQSNVVNENQRTVRILQGIIFSDPLIQGTQINGLSKFNSVDNRQAPLENGPITALVRTSATQREPGVLLAIGENGVSSFYYDGIQLTNIDGTSNVSTSDRYLASQRPLVGNYGAKKLRNICATPLGTVYYWSEGITDWIRYTNAGLEQLGETYQFMNYLRDQLDSSTSVMMTYDQVTDEAIIVGDDSNAYIFSERFKTFQGARQYYDTNNIRPERGATLSTRTFFFLEGHIWQMGPSVAATTENSFFGTLRDPSLTLVTNEMPTVAKQWNSIKVLGNRPLTCQMNSGNSELPSVESYIDQDWWINRKGDWDAAVRRDQNSVGGVMNGKIMESRILISTFAWDATDFDKLNYIEVKSNKSIVQ
jgi:hypothetical protein